MSRFTFTSIVSTVLLLAAFPATAQLTVTTNSNPLQLAQKILGKGVTILNAQLKGGNLQAGTFKAVPGSFLIDSGVVLTSGYAKTGSGPGGSGVGVNASASTQAAQGYSSDGSTGDPDLTFQGDGAETNDACVLEFDFIPQGDSIYVRYIFGSEEYPEYACTQFNDIFAFLITGPGILGKKNIALVPVTTAVVNVKINTVNSGIPGSAGGNIANCQLPPGSGSPFPQFYVDNQSSQHVVYDGHTVILTAKAKVIPCQTYHIRIGVADVNDGSHDSGVFIEANSFTSRKEIDTEEQGPYTDPLNNNNVTMIEACKTAQVKLKRAADVTGAFTLVRTYAGTATPGVDFTTDMPASITFTATDTEKIYNFTAPPDALNEGLEKLVIRFSKGTCTTQFVDSAILYIRDSLIYRTKSDTSFCTADPIIISGHAPEPIVTNSWQWNTGNTTQSITVSQPGTYIATHTYSERCLNIDTFNVISNDPTWTFNTADVFLCQGDTATLSVTTNATNITWNTGATTPSIRVYTPGQYWVNGVNAKGCSRRDTVDVFVQAAPHATLPSDTGMCQNNSVVLDGGHPGASSVWNTGATTPTITVSTPGQYWVTNTLNGCIAKDTVNVTVSPAPVINLGNDTSFCEDKSVVLNATYTGATHSWNTGATTPTINVNSSGQYWVVNSLNGCTASDTIDVTSKPIPSVELGADRSVCEQDTIHLDATYPGASHSWSNGATTAAIVASAAGKYTVVNTLNGCSATDSMTLVFKPIPVVNFGGDTSFCEDKSVVLNATFTGATHSWNTGATTPTINVNNTGQYWVVNSLNGCSDSDTINITSKPIPAVELGSDRTVCEQDTIHLDATYPGATYSWNNGATTATIVASTAGKYTVVNTLNGCTATDSMTLVVNPIPIVDFGGDTSICENKTVQLDATYTGASHTWNTGATTPSITVSTTGQYWVINTLNGCSDSDTINVTTTPIPLLELGADKSMCENETVQLNATFPGATYVWSNGATTGIITVSTGGKYTVISTMNNCSAVDSVTVVVKPIPVVDFGGDTTICENKTLTLNAAFPGATHSWSTGETTPTIVVSTDGQYSVFNSLNGCEARDTINVTTQAAPLVDLGADTSICAYDDMVLDAFYPNATYLWSNGDDSSAITVTAAGVYSVTSTLYGCPAADTITVSAKKMPVANAGFDMVVPQNTPAQLGAANHSNNATYLWSPAATLSDPTIRNPIANPTAPTTEYTVHIVSVDGCVGEDRVTVRVIYPISIPNAFSPNGDGINDKFVIKNLELYPRGRVYIFNRYGQQIYNQGGFNGPWDGSYKGKILEPATYYYIIDTGEGQRYTGYVVLLK